MIKTIASILFLTSNCFASPPDQWINWPSDGSVYLQRPACPGACYNIVVNGVLQEPTVSDLLNGQIVESSAKKAKRDLDAQAKKISFDAPRATLKSFDKTKITDLSQVIDLIDALRKAQGLDQ